MSKRDAAPLTARLLDRKRRADLCADSVPSQESTGSISDRPPPDVRAPQETSPTVHTVDLTPPDFLRATAFGLPPPAQKSHE